MILRHVEYADAEANVVEDAIHVSLVQLVDECLFWGKPNWEGGIGVLSCCAKSWNLLTWSGARLVLCTSISLLSHVPILLLFISGKLVQPKIIKK